MTSRARRRASAARLVRELALDYLACGLDPRRSILYRQSDLPETCELAWLLTTVTPMGLLQRAHLLQGQARGGAPARPRALRVPGAAWPPTSSSSSSDLVPVGQDQKQHLEMTRDIAAKFNQTYGREVFTLPEPHILEEVAVVPGVDGRKMSKSYDNTLAHVLAREAAQEGRDGDRHRLDAGRGAEGHERRRCSSSGRCSRRKDEREELFARAKAGGLGYGDVKKDLAERMLRFFAPMRALREDLARRPDEIEDVLRDGARRARELALETWAAAREAAGLGSV